MADDENFPIDENYKGIFYDDDSEKKYYEYGAHFLYKDLYKRLERLTENDTKQKSRKPKQNDKKEESNIDEIFSKVAPHSHININLNNIYISNNENKSRNLNVNMNHSKSRNNKISQLNTNLQDISSFLNNNLTNIYSSALKQKDTKDSIASNVNMNMNKEKNMEKDCKEVKKSKESKDIKDVIDIKNIKSMTKENKKPIYNKINLTNKQIQINSLSKIGKTNKITNTNNINHREFNKNKTLKINFSSSNTKNPKPILSSSYHMKVNTSIKNISQLSHLSRVSSSNNNQMIYSKIKYDNNKSYVNINNHSNKIQNTKINQSNNQYDNHVEIENLKGSSLLKSIEKSHDELINTSKNQIKSLSKNTSIVNNKNLGFMNHNLNNKKKVFSRNDQKIQSMLKESKHFTTKNNVNISNMNNSGIRIRFNNQITEKNEKNNKSLVSNKYLLENKEKDKEKVSHIRNVYYNDIINKFTVNRQKNNSIFKKNLNESSTEKNKKNLNSNLNSNSNEYKKFVLKQTSVMSIFKGKNEKVVFSNVNLNKKK